MSDFGFIDDGQSQKRFIRGIDGLHPDVELEVRLMLPTDQNRWHAELARTAEDRRAEVTSRYMAERIVGWSLRPEPSVANVGRTNLQLYDRLFAIIWGRDPGDPLPATGTVPVHDPEAAAGN